MTVSNDKESSKIPQTEEVDTRRRDFLKIAMTVSALLAFGGVSTVLKAISNPGPGAAISLTFPRVKVADASIPVGSVIHFDYPLLGEPNFLVRLGQKAVGGVGTDQDIVAFSQLCQHAGCPNISYQANSPYGVPVANCSCHGSVFNLLESAKVLHIPSPRPLPQVLLEVDSAGNIFAIGMGPPTIYFHNTGSNDVSYDLQGGTLVG